MTGISDEAVEAYGRAYDRSFFAHPDEHDDRDDIRAGLAAALPLLRGEWEAETNGLLSASESPGHPLPLTGAGSSGSGDPGPVSGVTSARPTGVHVYLSTGCLHGEHGYCAAMVGVQGAKRPARCKFCAAQCVCDCHAEARG